MPRSITIIASILFLLIQLSLAYYFHQAYLYFDLIFILIICFILLLPERKYFWPSFLLLLIYDLLLPTPFGILFLVSFPLIILSHFVFYTLLDNQSRPFIAVVTLVATLIQSLIFFLLIFLGNHFQIFSYPINFKEYLISYIILLPIFNALLILPIHILLTYISEKISPKRSFRHV